jgi:hypothetical protein
MLFMVFNLLLFRLVYQNVDLLWRFSLTKHKNLALMLFHEHVFLSVPLDEFLNPSAC